MNIDAPTPRLKARLRRYKLSPAQYRLLMEQHQNVCWICGDGDSCRLAIDHEHFGKQRVRGLLCKRCNMALGLLADDPVLVERARKYLLDPPAFRLLGT